LGSELLLTLIGGVALLLWGVRNVRTGMSRAFGTQLRAVLAIASRSRLTAAGAGAGVTMLLQSSTATALLLASLAGRGLVTLPVALAVMLGADVGTTLVAQLFSFSVRWLWVLPFAIGVLLFNRIKSDLGKGGGRLLMGIGLILLGLNVLADASQVLKHSPTLVVVFSALESEPLLAVLVATVVTWLAHSSLAIVLFIMSLALGGAVSAPLAVALVLGANLGGALAPFVASVGANASARRVALGNLLMRGAAVAVALPFVRHLASMTGTLSANPARLALNFHTLFNIALALCAFPFLDLLARAVSKALPEPEAGKDPGMPSDLDRSVLDTPSEALGCAMRETLRLGDLVLKMLKGAQTALDSNDSKLVKEIEKSDNAVDALHEAIKLYLIHASKADLNEAESRRYVEILTFTTNLEHIGDIIDKNLMELAAKKIKHRYAFSAEGAEELKRFHGHVVDNMKLALNVFATRDIALARRLLADKTLVRQAEMKAADSHFARLRQGRQQSIETSSIHLDVIRDLKRINSHLTSVAYPILEAAGELRESRLKAEAQQQAAIEAPVASSGGQANR
jgi:phosphate:Na+ symporter